MHRRPLLSGSVQNIASPTTPLTTKEVKAPPAGSAPPDPAPAPALRQEEGPSLRQAALPAWQQEEGPSSWQQQALLAWQQEGPSSQQAQGSTCRAPSWASRSAGRQQVLPSALRA